MTQIASLLVVATIFTWLIVCKYIFYRQRGGAYTQDKTTYAGTWAEKKQGGGGHKSGIVR